MRDAAAAGGGLPADCLQRAKAPSGRPHQRRPGPADGPAGHRDDHRRGQRPLLRPHRPGGPGRRVCGGLQGHRPLPRPRLPGGGHEHGRLPQGRRAARGATPGRPARWDIPWTALRGTAPAVSDLAVHYKDTILEMDFNPVFLYEKGTCAVDAVVVSSRPPGIGAQREERCQ